MAAILTHRLVSPRADFPAAVVFPAPRVNRPGSIELSEMFTTLWRTTREWLALLWMLGVVAFSALMVAGAAGFLA